MRRAELVFLGLLLAWIAVGIFLLVLAWLALGPWWALAVVAWSAVTGGVLGACLVVPRF